MKIQLLEVNVQPVFVVDRDGVLEKIPTQPATLSPKQWEEFINGGWKAELQRIEQQFKAQEKDTDDSAKPKS